MKTVYHFFVVIFLSGIIVSCSSDSSVDEGSSDGDQISTDIINNPGIEGEVNEEEIAAIEFEEESYDFGQILQGEKAKHTFKFTNTGETALIITSAQGSCGCTVPEWPREPIPAGESGQIDVEFNSAGKSGKQDKSVSIVANTSPNTSKIKIQAEVLVDEN